MQADSAYALLLLLPEMHHRYNRLNPPAGMSQKARARRPWRPATSLVFHPSQHANGGGFPKQRRISTNKQTHIPFFKHPKHHENSPKTQERNRPIPMLLLFLFSSRSLSVTGFLKSPCLQIQPRIEGLPWPLALSFYQVPVCLPPSLSLCWVLSYAMTSNGKRLRIISQTRLVREKN
jgi:hypothetical protein